MSTDGGHVRDLRRWAPDAAASAKVQLLREFDPTAVESGVLEVDDPYFGDGDAFDRCLSVVERACRGLVEHLRLELADQSRQSELADQSDQSELADQSRQSELAGQSKPPGGPI